MIAYFVIKRKNEEDVFVIPEAACRVQATPESFEKFISVNPDFGSWTGDSCSDLSPEHFGTIVASRAEGGDVCILKEDLWRERMFFYMSGAKKG